MVHTKLLSHWEHLREDQFDQDGYSKRQSKPVKSMRKQKQRLRITITSKMTTWRNKNSPVHRDPPEVKWRRSAQVEEAKRPVLSILGQGWSLVLGLRLLEVEREMQLRLWRFESSTNVMTFTLLCSTWSAHMLYVYDYSQENRQDPFKLSRAGICWFNKPTRNDVTQPCTMSGLHFQTFLEFSNHESTIAQPAAWSSKGNSCQVSDVDMELQKIQLFYETQWEYASDASNASGSFCFCCFCVGCVTFTLTLTLTLIPTPLLSDRNYTLLFVLASMLALITRIIDIVDEYVNVSFAVMSEWVNVLDFAIQTPFVTYLTISLQMYLSDAAISRICLIIPVKHWTFVRMTGEAVPRLPTYQWYTYSVPVEHRRRHTGQ